MEWIDTAAPHVRARIAGAVYLLYFVTAVVGEVFVQQAGLNGLQVNATLGPSTARALFDHQALFEVGLVIGTLSIGLYIALMGFFYTLFRPVSRTLTLIAVLFTVMGQAVAASASVLQLAPIAILGGGAHLSGFDAHQLETLSAVFLNVAAQAGPVSLLFAGLFQVVIGYVIYRSTFLPRILGVLVAAAGMGWFAFAVPPLAGAIAGPLEVLGFVAEAALMLWLLVKGVDDERWNARAQAATTR